MKRGFLSPYAILALLLFVLLLRDGPGFPVHNWPGLLIVGVCAYWILGRM